MDPLIEKPYTVGWICALPLEMAAAISMLDEEHGVLSRQDANDKNSYRLGRVGQHNVVIACLPSGIYGTNSAATVANQMLSTFKSLRFGLMVGIGGGVPSTLRDIRLGDIVVSKPQGVLGGVIQYDLGKATVGGKFIQVGSLNKPPSIVLTAVSSLQAKEMTVGNQFPTFLSEALAKHPHMQEKFSDQGAENDRLFEAEYAHAGGDTCESCDTAREVKRSVRKDRRPAVFYGTIASGNQVIKDGIKRDQVARQNDVLCFEMEAAGLMDSFPCLVVRGICDYSDSHKNKRWQEYAALTAASYAKEVLYTIPPSQVEVASAAISSTETKNTSSQEVEMDSLPSATYFLTNSLYMKDDLPLGSFVLDRRCPNQDTFTGLDVKEGTDYSIAVDKNFSELVPIESPSESIVKNLLARFFLPATESAHTDIYRVLADESRNYLLRQPKTLFQRLFPLKHVRRFLEECYSQGEDIYFVVGYRTLLNAQLARLESTEKSAGKDAFRTLGERIYAICYRKLTFRRFRGVESAALDSGSHWRLFSETGRSGETEDVAVTGLEDEDLTEESAELGGETWVSLFSEDEEAD